jgi:hypothetical protein
MINCHRPDNSAAVKNDIEPAEGAVYHWIWTVWVEALVATAVINPVLLGHGRLALW